jgi:hypothetical protein
MVSTHDVVPVNDPLLQAYYPNRDGCGINMSFETLVSKGFESWQPYQHLDSVDGTWNYLQLCCSALLDLHSQSHGC